MVHVCHEKAFHNYMYFIPSVLAIESGQPTQCNVRTAHNGKAGCNTIEYDKGFPVFFKPVFSMAWH